MHAFMHSFIHSLTHSHSLTHTHIHTHTYIVHTIHIYLEVRSPAGAKDFSSSLCVQTGSGAHPSSCTMGAGGPFPGGKARPRHDADHSSPSSAEVENE
jgi:hypothetical protein